MGKNRIFWYFDKGALILKKRLMERSYGQIISYMWAPASIPLSIFLCIKEFSFKMPAFIILLLVEQFIFGFIIPVYAIISLIYVPTRVIFTKDKIIIRCIFRKRIIQWQLIKSISFILGEKQTVSPKAGVHYTKKYHDFIVTLKNKKRYRIFRLYLDILPHYYLNILHDISKVIPGTIEEDILRIDE